MTLKQARITNIDEERLLVLTDPDGYGTVVIEPGGHVDWYVDSKGWEPKLNIARNSTVFLPREEREAERHE